VRRLEDKGFPGIPVFSFQFVKMNVCWLPCLSGVAGPAEICLSAYYY